MHNYTILLPPSEGKNSGGVKGIRPTSNEVYDKLLEFTSTASIDDLRKVFGIEKESLVLEAKKLIQNYANEPLMTATERYSGVMFEHINYSSMNGEMQAKWDKNVMFIDGLFGLLGACDMIPNYKLPISAKFLINGRAFNVANHWKTELEKPLLQLLENGLLIDILPKSHRNAIHPSVMEHSNYLQVNFYEMKGGVPKNSGHNSKRLKGELVRYLLGHESLDRDVIERFIHSQGHSYNADLSTHSQVVFLFC